MQAKILKSIQHKKNLGPAEVIVSVAPKQSKDKAAAEAALRDLIVQGKVIFNSNRKLVLSGP